MLQSGTGCEGIPRNKSAVLRHTAGKTCVWVARGMEREALHPQALPYLWR